jgi:hypothetical protein
MTRSIDQLRKGVTPKPPQTSEVGVSAHLPFMVSYRNAWEALRSEEVTVQQLVAMRKTDGQARALYRLITLPIRAALKAATFVPENNIEGGEEEAAFIEQMFTLPTEAGGMSVPFGRLVAQMLMAVFDGFAAFELVYWSPRTGPLKDKWTLKKAAHRPSESVTFLLDDHSEWVGLRQQTMYQNRSVDVTIPAEDCMYYAANEEERAYYGQSYFQAAFYHWDKKFRLYVIAHIACQRAAVGTRVGTLPLNPDVVEEASFKKALADLGVAQYMTIPEGYKVDSLREGTNFDFLAYINHHNSQMSKSVLAAFFDDNQGSGGDTTLVDFGRQSDALFLLMLETIMGELEEVINQRLIPRFIDWNFGSGKYPKFQFGSLSQEQKAALLDMFKTLSTAGQALTITPEFVHELEKQVAEQFGLEIDYDSIEARKAEEAQAAADQLATGVLPGEDPAAPTLDPSLVPAGFVLTDTGEAVELTRGVPTTGGPKVVRTPAGARVYGEPIGTPITRDMAQRTAAQGVKGKPFGAQRGKTGAAGGHRVYGGGPGAPAQNPGGVVTTPNAHATPKRVFTNAAAPGAQLLDFGDGTVAIRDAQGRLSARQPFDIKAFLKLGWVVQVKPPSGKTTAPAAVRRAPVPIAAKALPAR